MYYFDIDASIAIKAIKSMLLCVVVEIKTRKNRQFEWNHTMIPSVIGDAVNDKLIERKNYQI
jgi:hypothetical protein